MKARIWFVIVVVLALVAVSQWGGALSKAESLLHSTDYYELANNRVLLTDFQTCLIVVASGCAVTLGYFIKKRRVLLGLFLTDLFLVFSGIIAKAIIS